MSLRNHVSLSLMLCAGVSLVSLPAMGQDETHHRGRKYKAPPVTSHVEVTVLKALNGKPIANAAVVFHPIKDGKDEGNLEVKTDPDGKAIIDVIQTGSDLRVQVIANGYATFGQDYMVDGATKEIAISMVQPRAQVSAYTEKTDKPAERKPGVQEPAGLRTATPPAAPPPPAPSSSAPTPK